MTNFGCRMQIYSYTDSAASFGKGFGAYFQGKWTYGIWPSEWFMLGTIKDITVLELIPMFVAIEISAIERSCLTVTISQSVIF